MFLEIEGEVFINLMTIERIVLRWAKKEAVIYVGGVMVAESQLAFQYFMQNRESLVVRVEAEQSKVA